MLILALNVSRVVYLLLPVRIEGEAVFSVQPEVGF